MGMGIFDLLLGLIYLILSVLVTKARKTINGQSLYGRHTGELIHNEKRNARMKIGMNSSGQSLAGQTFHGGLRAAWL